jgi:hypothetical protein
MKWHPANPKKVIGGEYRHMEVLLLVAPLPDILVGKHGMLPLIAHGRKIFKKW